MKKNPHNYGCCTKEVLYLFCCNVYYNLQKLKESISQVKPVSGLDVREFRFAVFGPVGGGKSSFINTVLSAFADRITQHAVVGRSSVHTSNTQKVRTLSLIKATTLIIYKRTWVNQSKS